MCLWSVLFYHQNSSCSFKFLNSFQTVRLEIVWLHKCRKMLPYFTFFETDRTQRAPSRDPYPQSVSFCLQTVATLLRIPYLGTSKNISRISWSKSRFKIIKLKLFPKYLLQCTDTNLFTMIYLHITCQQICTKYDMLCIDTAIFSKTFI